MRPKLYLATKEVTAMFLCYDESSLMKNANKFLAEEERNMVPGRVSVKEIKLIDEIPAEWRKGGLLWGTDEEITPEDFLQDPEYLEYLRLKAKFE